MSVKEIVLDIVSVANVKPSIVDITREYKDGFQSYIDLVMDGKEGNRVWTAMSRLEAKSYSRQIRKTVEDYWESNYYDHTYGWYRGMQPGVPYKESLELVTYISHKIIRLFTNAIYAMGYEQVKVVGYTFNDFIMRVEFEPLDI